MELNTCVLCGKKYVGMGNSTWGYWQLHGCTSAEDASNGEKMRCCNNCNFYYVIPARMKLSEQEKQNAEMDRNQNS